MKLYAESSAVLRWLLGAADGELIRTTMASAELVVTSALTTAEVARTLRRLREAGELDGVAHDRAWIRYRAVLAHWDVCAVTAAILARVEERFPAEPVRTLDAIHLSTALQLSLEVAPLTVLSTDKRVLENAIGLGLSVTPPSPG